MHTCTWTHNLLHMLCLVGYVWRNKLLTMNVATPLWGKCEVATHTPENGTWESSRTPKSSKLDCKGQKTLHWNVLYTIGKVLKCKCPKWPCMSHLDICSTGSGRKKGRESNWQFDSWPLKVGNRPDPGGAGEVRHTVGKLSMRTTSLLQTSSQSEVGARSYEHPKSRESKPGQFRDSTLGVPGKSAIWMQVRRWDTKNTIWGKVAASPESKLWWVKWVQCCPWLVPTLKGCRMSSNQLVSWFWMQDRITK